MWQETLLGKRPILTLSFLQVVAKADLQKVTICAGDSATNYPLFPDIELYPSLNTIPDFLSMIRRNESPLKRTAPKVFVFPIFEIEKGHELPSSKQELVELLRKNIMIPFHQRICSICHAIPNLSGWTKDLNGTGKIELSWSVVCSSLQRSHRYNKLKKKQFRVLYKP